MDREIVWRSLGPIGHYPEADYISSHPTQNGRQEPPHHNQEI